MEPLQTIPMPTHGVLAGVTTANSWPITTAGFTVRTAYVATNSIQQLSFAALQSAAFPGNVLHVASRPALYDDMPSGVVLEIHLAQDLRDGETICVSLAQAGATAYYPPQQIDDAS